MESCPSVLHRIVIQIWVWEKNILLLITNHCDGSDGVMRIGNHESCGSKNRNQKDLKKNTNWAEDGFSQLAPKDCVVHWNGNPASAMSLYLNVVPFVGSKIKGDKGFEL